MRATVRTAGERVELDCSLRWLSRLLEEGTVGQLTSEEGPAPDVRVTVEAGTAPFDTSGWEVLTRGAWRRPGQVVVRDACSSGLDLLVTATGPIMEVTARWRPPISGRAASAVLRARSALLLRAVLVQYPALWWSGQRGRAPLHASVCTVGDGRTVLIAGPGGVGKSTLVNAELARGGRASCDNLCVSDGTAAWGLLEPRRVPAGTDGGHGRRMPHGRREAGWTDRADQLTPDVVLVLRRESAGGTATALASPTTVTACRPADAARALVAGTYMAGELRRYWGFAATLALGTRVGPVHPEVDRVAQQLTSQLRCVEVILGAGPRASLETLLARVTETAVR
jgi:hypothetical protein